MAKRFQIGLGMFVIATALSAPLAAWLLRPLLLPPAWTAGGKISIADSQAPDPLMEIVWVPGTRTEQLSHIIVRPGIPRGLPGTTEPIDFINSDGIVPDEKGISLRRQLVFLDGKEWRVKSRPCFLVFDPVQREFVEVPIGDANIRIDDKDDVPSITEWKSEVVPRLRQIESDWKEDILRQSP